MLQGEAEQGVVVESAGEKADAIGFQLKVMGEGADAELVSPGIYLIAPLPIGSPFGVRVQAVPIPANAPVPDTRLQLSSQTVDLLGGYKARVVGSGANAIADFSNVDVVA